jgi:hypothetical protein
MDGRRRMAGLLLVLAQAAVACGGQGSEGAPTDPPAVVEAADSAGVRHVVLSDQAARRLGIETAAVTVDRDGRTMVPYSAVLYDTAGQAWVYTNPEGLVFVRVKVDVQRANGETVALSSGLPVGTRVAVVGVPELFGTEAGVGSPE